MLKHIQTGKILIPAMAGCAVILSVPVTIAGETEEYDENRVYVEINATDGDAGFHGLVDGDAWKETKLLGSKLLNTKAFGSLREQGITEFFFESDEPPCYCEDPGGAASPEELEEYEECLEERVTVAEVLERFPTGTYEFKGKSIEPGDKLGGETELTHSLPAAPVIDDAGGPLPGTVSDGSENVDPDDAVIGWAEGDDLGECDPPVGFEPADVLFYEVTVEPDDDEELPEAHLIALENSGPLRVFTVQVPADQFSVQVSPEYLSTYKIGGVVYFKFEVGGVEDREIDGESTKGNQTFSEGTFDITDEV